jgi:hypothetical protein
MTQAFSGNECGGCDCPPALLFLRCKKCFSNLDISAFTHHPADCLRYLTSVALDQSVNAFFFGVVGSVWTWGYNGPYFFWCDLVSSNCMAKRQLKRDIFSSLWQGIWRWIYLWVCLEKYAFSMRVYLSYVSSVFRLVLFAAFCSMVY